MVKINPKEPSHEILDYDPPEHVKCVVKTMDNKATFPLKRDAAHCRRTEHPRVRTAYDANSPPSSRTKITKPLSFKIEFKVTGGGSACSRL